MTWEVLERLTNIRMASALQHVLFHLTFILGINVEFNVIPRYSLQWLRLGQEQCWRRWWGFSGGGGWWRRSCRGWCSRSLRWARRSGRLKPPLQASLWSHWILLFSPPGFFSSSYAWVVEDTGHWAMRGVGSQGDKKERQHILFLYFTNHGHCIHASECDQRTKWPMDQWANGLKVQWTRGTRDQGTNGPRNQGTNGPMDQWTNGPLDQWTINSCDPMKRKTQWNIGSLEH